MFDVGCAAKSRRPVAGHEWVELRMRIWDAGGCMALGNKDGLVLFLFNYITKRHS